jgi:hypothetical protein
VHVGGGGNGIHTGPQESWLVAERDDNAHRDLGRVRPHNLELVGSRAHFDCGPVAPAAEHLSNVVHRGLFLDGSGPRRAVAEDFGYVNDRVSGISGGERAFVFEGGGVRCHQAWQLVRHVGPHREGPPDVCSGQEELGREVGLELRRRPGAIGPHLVLVRIDHAGWGERGGQERDGVGRPDVTREEQGPRQAPSRFEPDPEEVSPLGRAPRSENLDTSAMAQACRLAHESSDCRQPFVDRDHRE